MFERHHEPLLPRAKYYRRILRGAAFAFLIVCGSLGIGVLGYHLAEGMTWLDSLVSASMILFGEGPLTELHTTAGKWFASFYAMFSGVAFITIVGVVFAPAFHRFLHKFHLEFGDDGGKRKKHV